MQIPNEGKRVEPNELNQVTGDSPRVILGERVFPLVEKKVMTLYFVEIDPSFQILCQL